MAYWTEELAKERYLHDIKIAGEAYGRRLKEARKSRSDKDIDKLVEEYKPSYEWKAKRLEAERKRGQQVLRMREGGKTLQAIGNELGISRERVRCLEAREVRRQQEDLCPYATLSVRALNVITNEGLDINNIRAIAEHGASRFMRAPSCGKKTVADIATWLAVRGERLAP